MLDLRESIKRLLRKQQGHQLHIDDDASWDAYLKRQKRRIHDRRWRNIKPTPGGTEWKEHLYRGRRMRNARPWSTLWKKRERKS